SGNWEATIIDNGVYQLAMIPLQGWEKSEVILRNGLHPVSEISKVSNVEGTIVQTDGNYFVSLMLWKRSGEQWDENELFPVEEWETLPDGETVEIRWKDGRKQLVSYKK